MQSSKPLQEVKGSNLFIYLRFWLDSSRAHFLVLYSEVKRALSSCGWKKGEDNEISPLCSVISKGRNDYAATACNLMLLIFFVRTFAVYAYGTYMDMFIMSSRWTHFLACLCIYVSFNIYLLMEID